MAECTCKNEGVTTLLYACSGASNVGYLSDQVSRKIMKQGFGKMTCLAAVGAELSGFHKSALAAGKNIVIDGCSVSCGKKIFDNFDLKPYTHIILTDMGAEKGKTEVTQIVIDEMAEKVKENM